MECVVISAHVVAEISAVSWTVEKIAQLIDSLYETYPCLYNTRDKSYHDRDKRTKAITEIATTLEVTGMFSLVYFHVRTSLATCVWNSHTM